MGMVLAVIRKKDRIRLKYLSRICRQLSELLVVIWVNKKKERHFLRVRRPSSVCRSYKSVQLISSNP